MAKLDRYSHFLTGYSGHHGDSSTFYSSVFKDGWPAEVLFVAQTDARRQTIDEVIRERETAARREMPVRAYTMAETQVYLRRAIYKSDRLPGAPRRNSAQRNFAVPPAMAPVAPPAAPTGPARSAEEERLRRGRVAVRGEQLVEFEKTMQSTVAALQRAREALARMNVAPDALPAVPATVHGTLRLMSEYARRGSEALAKYRISGAD